ncbi:MAG TPA: hypothetical protein PKE31_12435 [Pseudomonadota bacterium]|nr:hypothetical protein [Pseudomonadota bacterium]
MQNTVWFRRSLFALALSFAGLMSGCGRSTVTSSVYLTWRIVDAKEPDANVAPALDCSSKNVKWVRVQLAGAQPFDFPCTAYSGESTSFESGTYVVDVMALNPTGQAVAAKRSTMDLFGRMNLGNFIFQVQ